MVISSGATLYGSRYRRWTSSPLTICDGGPQLSRLEVRRSRTVWVNPEVECGLSYQRLRLTVPPASVDSCRMAGSSFLYAYKCFEVNLTASKVVTGKETPKQAKTGAVLVSRGALVAARLRGPAADGASDRIGPVSVKTQGIGVWQ